MLVRTFRPCWGKAKVLVTTLALCLIFLNLTAHFLLSHGTVKKPTFEESPVGPLSQRFVEDGVGEGGRWYIPPSWQQGQAPEANASVLHAAEHTLGLVLRQSRFLDNSRIPLIAHQTWRTFDTNSWPAIIRECVEDWIEIAVGDGSSEMAWFLWDDAGIDALMKKYEPELYDDFLSLPYAVEKADIFRIVVVKWFGGVYADVDVKHIKHPKEWIYDEDLIPWTDFYSKATHSLQSPHNWTYEIPSVAPTSYSELYHLDARAADHLLPPAVNAIFGIEADNAPDPDPSYWRMGYSFPVQLTNWALAMAPLHPVATQFLVSLASSIADNLEHLREVDPLELTGPPALTAAVRTVAIQNDASLTWDALSARNGDPEGGRAKIVARDALILPITGFSPGRGWFQNMGSKSAAHPNARLWHAAAGSWKNMDVRVHYGKLCRQLFGMCRDWKKISD